MFDAVRNNKRFVQIFLALIILPFALWGVDSYIHNFGRDTDVAKIGRIKITQSEFQEAMREEQDRLRQQMGEAFDPDILKHPEVRESVLERLINQRLLQLQVAKDGIQATPEALREVIGDIDAFKENGQFSMQRYEQLLATRGMTRENFEAKLARDIAQQQLLAAVAGSAFSPSISVDRWLSLQDEKREVSIWTISAAKFVSQVKLAPDAARKEYDSDLKRWEQPEQVRVEYLVLSLEALAQQISISDQELRKEYEAHKDKYAAPEERRARHILIEVAKDAPADKRAAAKEKVEALLKQVKAKPESFAELAKANSSDKGSAEKGGDLGFFGRGQMVKPFEDAAFKLKPGEISGVVETDYGYHIIKLEAIHGGALKSFDEVKQQIADELKHAAAAKKFTELADMFANTVYEQPDTLKGAAEKFKLPLQQSGWISKDSAKQDASGLFKNEKLLAAIFSADTLKNNRNTEAIDVGNNTLVSARLIEHKPAAVTPFETVRAQIEQKLTAEAAAQLATAEGEKRLAALQKGETVTAEWSPQSVITRFDAGNLPPDALKAIFRVQAEKLPAYVGVTVPGQAYLIARISKIEQPQLAQDDPRRKGLAAQYDKLFADEDMRAYIAALRERYKVTKNMELLNAKE
ncbi:MAG: SurA N-terminal domain-containing protein [Betaproteobacteria bacterium]|nr:SurA N-terminal domain-containing protein [Betaproteobacteria bacterium]